MCGIGEKKMQFIIGRHLAFLCDNSIVGLFEKCVCDVHSCDAFYSTCTQLICSIFKNERNHTEVEREQYFIKVLQTQTLIYFLHRLISHSRRKESGQL